MADIIMTVIDKYITRRATKGIYLSNLGTSESTKIPIPKPLRFNEGRDHSVFFSFTWTYTIFRCVHTKKPLRSHQDERGELDFRQKL